MPRYIDVDALKKDIKENYVVYGYEDFINDFFRCLDEQPTVDAEPKWIPITSRPMDDKERIEWSEKLGYDIAYDEAMIYTSQLPDDGKEVLTCDLYGTIRIDTFENDPDYGCGFEENGDMDGIVAWMPLPKPYRAKMDGEEK